MKHPSGIEINRSRLKPNSIASEPWPIVQGHGNFPHRTLDKVQGLSSNVMIKEKILLLLLLLLLLFICLYVYNPKLAGLF